MKRSRFSEEQIIGVLREDEAGATAADLARKYGTSTATFCGWKARLGGMDVSDARRRARMLALPPRRGRDVRMAEDASQTIQVPRWC